MNDFRELDVVIPALNVQDLLPRLLDSLIPDLQIIGKLIVIDNGSEDATQEVLSSWMSLHPEVEVIYEIEPVRGACISRNRGIQHCTSEWVRFLDADDLVWTKSCSELLTFAKQSNADLIYSDFIRRSADGVERIAHALADPLEAIASFQSGTTGSTLFRMDKFGSFGNWNESYTSAQENELMHRWARQGAILCYFPHVTYVHLSRNDGSQISSGRADRRNRNRLMVAKESFQWFLEEVDNERAQSLIAGEFFNAIRRYYEYEPKMAKMCFEELDRSGIKWFPNPGVKLHHYLAYQIGGPVLVGAITRWSRKWFGA